MGDADMDRTFGIQMGESIYICNPMLHTHTLHIVSFIVQIVTEHETISGCCRRNIACDSREWCRIGSQPTPWARRFIPCVYGPLVGVAQSTHRFEDRVSDSFLCHPFGTRLSDDHAITSSCLGQGIAKHLGPVCLCDI